jgi:hypothetical protein
MRWNGGRVVAVDEREAAHSYQLQVSVLVGCLVIACSTAGLAVKKSVGAEADVNHGLAEAAVFFALASRLGLLALGAANLGGTGSGAHKDNVA